MVVSNQSRVAALEAVFKSVDANGAWMEI